MADSEIRYVFDDYRENPHQLIVQTIAGSVGLRIKDGRKVKAEIRIDPAEVDSLITALMKCREIAERRKE